MKYTYILIVLLNLYVQQVSSAIINDGKFFYTSMRSGTKPGETVTVQEPLAVHVVDVLVSNENTMFALGLNTNFSSIALMSKNCADCNVSQKYDPSTSSTKSYDVPPVNLNQQANIFQQVSGSENMLNTQLTSQAMNEYMKIQLYKYTREVTLNITFANVLSTNTAFETYYDGYIGIEPWGAKPLQKEGNFMWQLQHNQSMIDHQVVMVNAMNTRGNSSVIKFGGYDVEALQPGSALTILKTANEKSWTLMASEFKYNDTSVLTGAEKNIDLNPHLPYLYIPSADWTHLAFQVNSMYERTPYPIDCNYGSNYCRWQQPCSTLVDAGMEKELLITLKGSDATTTFDFVTKQGTLLIDGKNFGFDPNTYCYLPIFMSTLQDESSINSWYMGSLFMMQYVVVYDNTPWDEHSQAFCQIGFGVADPLQVEKEFETLYDGIQPIEALDMSHKIGAWDPIKPIPVPPKPVPTPPTPTPTKPPGPVEQWIIDHLVLIIIGVLVGCCLVVLIVRKIMKGPPKTYYNGLYSLADDKQPRINES